MRPLFNLRDLGLRPYLLAAFAAAFLLVPAMAANAATSSATIEITGEGSGAVYGDPGPLQGSPPIVCARDGGTEEYATEVPPWLESELPKYEYPLSSGEFIETGEHEINCSGVMGESSGLFGVTVHRLVEPGSLWENPPGWETTATPGDLGGSCPPAGTICGAVSFTDSPYTVKAAFDTTVPPPVPLTIDTEVGTGSGQVNCVVNGGESEDTPCEPQYEPGTELELIAVEDLGSEFIGFENGTGDAEGCTTSPCGPFTLEEASEVDANFGLEPLPTFPLTVTVTGQGEVTSTPAGIECSEAENGSAACEEEVEEGASVTLQAEETVAEWVFVEWTEGPCAGESSLSCEFTMPAEAEQAAAEFAETNEAPLSVVKNGGGEGTVTSLSPDTAIDCGATCTAEYEVGDPVTLMQEPTEPGSAFAGWVGCTQISATECEVEVASGGTQVTAIFIAVPVITTEPAGANCAEGGVKIEYAGETFYVCNGEEGEDGQDGNDGADGNDGNDGQNGNDGADGQDGSNGQNGSNGQDGSAGPAGPPGVPGVPGVQGPRGKPGPQGRIVCNARSRGKRIVVRCRVKSNKRKGKRAKRSQRVRWAVMQGGEAQHSGKTSVRRLQRTLNRLPEGRYVLRIKGQRRGTRVAVR